MKTHTPGPWALTNTLGVIAVRVGKKIIASFSGDNAEDVANAHLVWAAPDMLEALDLIMGVTQTDLETHFGGRIGAKIRAAVAKARGAQ